ncbi:MAG: hypothetical protein CMH63_01615 [Nanoarchaeota archaeon]|jgi:hypothetical protein|nr:hypothetical protein [Nanoarchaeota archaeon]|tara:strand:+ start:7662 stop:7901 length:240 start_codon:yes stop_codon:yes gene_type:complete
MTEENNMNKDEQIGFHKGSIATLAKEREELVKIVQVVEQIMQAHNESLKKLGVDLEAQAKELQEKMKEEEKSKLDERVA